MTEPELVGNAAAEELGFSKEDIDEEKVKQWPPSVSFFDALSVLTRSCCCVVTSRTLMTDGDHPVAVWSPHGPVAVLSPEF